MLLWEQEVGESCMCCSLVSSSAGCQCQEKAVLTAHRKYEINTQNKYPMSPHKPFCQRFCYVTQRTSL